MNSPCTNPLTFLCYTRQQIQSRQLSVRQVHCQKKICTFFRESASSQPNRPFRPPGLVDSTSKTRMLFVIYRMSYLLVENWMGNAPSPKRLCRVGDLLAHAVNSTYTTLLLRGLWCISIEPQWLPGSGSLRRDERVTKAIPVAALSVMSFVNPPLTADTNRILNIFSSLAHNLRRAREGNVFSQKALSRV